MGGVFSGQVRNGVVVFEHEPAPLADGTRVHIEPVAEAEAEAEGGRTLAHLFAGRLGRIHSGGRERLSEECGVKFAEHLWQAHRSGEVEGP
jgi:hypothetical protein